MSEENDSVLNRAKGMLDRVIRVRVSDSREFVGVLHCIDHSGNLILHDVFKIDEHTHDITQGEHVGCVMVPAKHIETCLVAKKSAKDDNG